MTDDLETEAEETEWISSARDPSIRDVLDKLEQLERMLGNVEVMIDQGVCRYEGDR